MEIFDKSGNPIAISDPPQTRIFSRMDLRNAFLAGAKMQGVTFDRSNLQGSDFKGADLYGARLVDSNCDGCSFAKADLRGARIRNVSFRNADMRGARFSLDEMNKGMALRHVDFTNANLDGADFTGAIYDSGTIFPVGFDPAERGLTPEHNADL